MILIPDTLMLVALEVNSLLHALVSLYVTNDAASYGRHLRAMLVLKYLVRKFSLSVKCQETC